MHSLIAYDTPFIRQMRFTTEPCVTIDNTLLNSQIPDLPGTPETSWRTPVDLPPLLRVPRLEEERGERHHTIFYSWRPQVVPFAYLSWYAFHRNEFGCACVSTVEGNRRWCWQGVGINEGIHLHCSSSSVMVCGESSVSWVGQKWSVRLPPVPRLTSGSDTIHLYTT